MLLFSLRITQSCYHTRNLLIRAHVKLCRLRIRLYAMLGILVHAGNKLIRLASGRACCPRSKRTSACVCMFVHEHSCRNLAPRAKCKQAIARCPARTLHTSITAPACHTQRRAIACKNKRWKNSQCMHVDVLVIEGKKKMF